MNGTESPGPTVERAEELIADIRAGSIHALMTAGP
jgi:hypothetical protein